jgi:hypothetical protein
VPEAILEIIGEVGGREKEQESQHGNFAEQHCCCPQKDFNGGRF